MSTAVGTFGDCWLITTVISAANSNATWYCRGPGVVRRELPACGSGNPYGSYVVFELVDWRPE